MSDRLRAPTWRAHIERRLDEIRVSLLDLIDVGVPKNPPTPRHPSKREQAATDRPDGNFQPTVTAVSSRSTYSDPTGGEVLAWEGEVQDATTRLYAAVTVAHEVADGLGLTPTDEHNRPIPAPTEPPTRATTTGRLIVDLPPAAPHLPHVDHPPRPDCRRAVLAGATYIAAVADQLADRMTDAEGDVADAVDSRAHWLEASVATLAFRLAPPPPRKDADDRRSYDRPRRPCACDWDGCVHDEGECGNRTPDRTCSTCRHRKTASRRAAS